MGDPDNTWLPHSTNWWTCWVAEKQRENTALKGLRAATGQSKRERHTGRRRKSAIEKHWDFEYAYIEACQETTHTNIKAAENNQSERQRER